MGAPDSASTRPARTALNASTMAKDLTGCVVPIPWLMDPPPRGSAGVRRGCRRTRGRARRAGLRRRPRGQERLEPPPGGLAGGQLARRPRGDRVQGDRAGPGRCGGPEQRGERAPPGETGVLFTPEPARAAALMDAAEPPHVLIGAPRRRSGASPTRAPGGVSERRAHEGRRAPAILVRTGPPIAGQRIVDGPAQSEGVEEPSRRGA